LLRKKTEKSRPPNLIYKFGEADSPNILKNKTEKPWGLTYSMFTYF
jgi:hypothetical protein